LTQIADNLGYQPAQIRRWFKRRDALLARRSTALSTNSGRASCLGSIEEPILQWIFENREVGLPISHGMIVIKASQLDSSFRRKSARTKDQSVRRFLNTHKLAIRIATHESHRHPSEVTAEAMQYLTSIWPRMTMGNRHAVFILNIDQTPIFLSMKP
jgi:hypothetical protein